MLEENYMAALIIRLPDGKHERLKDLARARKQSVTKLFDEMATVLLAEYDAETRFHVARGAWCGQDRARAATAGEGPRRKENAALRLSSPRKSGSKTFKSCFTPARRGSRRSCGRGRAPAGRARPAPGPRAPSPPPGP